MVIKVKYSNREMPRLKSIEKGEWVDLYTDEAYASKAPEIVNNKAVFDSRLISLGVAMKLPKGFEAVVNARSSSYKKFGFILWNGQGVIDNSYCGNEDVWKCPCLFYYRNYIPRFSRICQFRIQLSQKATFLDKLRWLLSSKIRFVEVDNLEEKSRGGFGSTGTK